MTTWKASPFFDLFLRRSLALSPVLNPPQVGAFPESSSALVRGAGVGLIKWPPGRRFQSPFSVPASACLRAAIEPYVSHNRPIACNLRPTSLPSSLCYCQSHATCFINAPSIHRTYLLYYHNIINRHKGTFRTGHPMGEAHLKSREWKKYKWLIVVEQPFPFFISPSQKQKFLKYLN